jgi:hypothetical protein
VNGCFGRCLALLTLIFFPDCRSFSAGITLRYPNVYGITKTIPQCLEDFFFVPRIQQTGVALVKGQYDITPGPGHGSIAGQISGHAHNVQTAEVPLPKKIRWL